MAGPDIDALIEEGLTRYGRGDLDGALLVWEEALGVDPENAQANSYVDYVRQNYDLLTGGDAASDESHAPFAIEDDEYSVEIIEGAVLAQATAAPAEVDPLDEGWFIDSGASAAPVQPATEVTVQSTAVVEIEAEEPPSFESETGQYDKRAHQVAAPDATAVGVRAIPDDDDEPEISVSTSVPEATPEPASGEFPSGGHTPGFGDGLAAQDSTPVGFAAQVTDIRVRDLGFVQAKKPVVDDEPEIEVHHAPEPEPEPEPEPPEASAVTAAGEPTEASPPITDGAPEPEPEPETEEVEKSAMQSPPPSELQVTFRTPTLDKIENAIAAADAIVPPSLDGETVQTHAVPSAEPVPPAAPPPPPAGAFSPEATATEQTHLGAKPSPPPPPLPEHTDADLLAAPRNPHAPDTDDVILPPSPSAPTRELPLAMQMPMPVMADERNRTRDLSWEVGQDRRPTQRLPLTQQIDISAPTRELGMRPPTRNDIITARIDARSARAAVPITPGGRAGDDTRADIKSPFDPIDARGAQILDDIDVHAPENEAKEDRTRRRITALIEKAAEWQRALDLEKAVTAIDLALAEDPSTALAQKLIHRNRDTIMAVFQSYIGDLQRAPILARPLHELASAPISPRAAFLLSRVDGTMSIDEILDVSGMPRLEAFRYLCQLLLRGILR